MHILIYVGFFLAGVVLDEVFGARIVKKVVMELLDVESRLKYFVVNELAKIKGKL